MIKNHSRPPQLLQLLQHLQLLQLSQLQRHQQPVPIYNPGQETVPISTPGKNYNLGQEYIPDSSHGREYSPGQEYNPGQEAIAHNHGQERGISAAEINHLKNEIRQEVMQNLRQEVLQNNSNSK